MPTGVGALYHFGMWLADPRRVSPRITLEGLCGVVDQGDLRYAAMVDLSSLGIRLERPFDRRTASRTLQLEIEIPGVALHDLRQ